ncbi:MAG: PilZ domain-containing protein [Polyangiaceae bacterium]|nr:PilZ domain-containing protein [Polyangiaceae bacterium]
MIHRRPTRHSMRAACQVVRLADFSLIADRMENLSTWGCLVSPADPVLTGEHVLVSFQIPGTDERLEVDATVTRVIHGRRPGENTRKLGLEFENLAPYERFRLRRALRERPIVPPGPRPGRRSRQFDLAALLA